MQRFERTSVLLALVLTAGCPGPAANFSSDDRAAVERTVGAYFDAWLANDSAAVMSTLVAEPVLSPFGMPALEGADAARAFWWPADSPPTSVNRFDHQTLELDGSGELAYARGAFTLGFDYDGEAYTSRGTFLMLLREDADRGWRISHYAWNDVARQ